MNDIFGRIAFITQTQLVREIQDLIPWDMHDRMEYINQLIVQNTEPLEPELQDFFSKYRDFIINNFTELIEPINWNSLLTMINSIYGSRTKELYIYVYTYILNNQRPVFEISYVGKLVEYFFDKYQEHLQLTQITPSRKDIISDIIPFFAEGTKYDYYFEGKLAVPVLKGHRFPVDYIHTLSDNKLITSDEEHIFIIWDSQGNKVFTLDDSYNSILVLSDSQIITGWRQTLTIRSSTGQVLTQIQINDDIEEIYILDSYHIILIYRHNSEIWNINTWERIFTFTKPLYFLRILPNSNFAYESMNTIKIWSLQKRDYIVTIPFIDNFRDIICLSENLIAIHTNDRIDIYHNNESLSYRQYPEMSKVIFIPSTEEFAILISEALNFYDSKTWEYKGTVLLNDINHYLGSLPNGDLVYHNYKNMIQIIDPNKKMVVRFFSKSFDTIKLLPEGRIVFILKNNEVHILR